MKALLRLLGVPSQCRGCWQPIVWITNPRTRRHSPYDVDGGPHFATCPAAEQFRRPRRG